MHEVSLGDRILTAWSTNAEVTRAFVSRLPPEIWKSPIPGLPRRTVGSLAAHLHNARRMWIRTIGEPHGGEVPANVDLRRVTCAQLVRALSVSARGIEDVLRFGLAHEGVVPPTPRYVWRNLPLDVGHILSYFVSHESHHRGQLVLIARQLGHRVPNNVRDDLWQWSRIVRARSS